MTKALVKLVLLIALLLAPLSLRAMPPQEAVLYEIRQSLEHGQYDRARALLRAMSSFEGDYLWLEMEIAMKEGRISQALRFARKIVALAPDHLPGRRALANLLFIDKRYASAEYHYAELLKIDPSPEARGFYVNRMRSIAGYQPYGVSASFSLTPSNNINGANLDGVQWVPYHPFYPMFGRYKPSPAELAPQFGWRAGVNLSAYARYRIGDQNQFFYRLNADINRYTVKTLDNAALSLGVYWRREAARGKFEIGGEVERYWGDNLAYAHNVSKNTVALVNEDEGRWIYALSFSGDYIYPPGLQLNANLRIARMINDDQDKNGYKDNLTLALQLGGKWAVSERHILSFGIGGRRYDEYGNGKENWHRDYWGKSVNIGVNSAWEKGWVTGISLNYEHRFYDAGSRSYEGKLVDGKVILKTRKDDVFGLNLNILNTNWSWNGLAPRLNCSLSYTDSNIRLFDMLNGACGISLTTQF